MEGLELWFGDERSVLSVRHFLTHEAINEPYWADVWARAENPSLDLEAMTGVAASFVVVTGDKNAVPGRRRVFDGICERAEQIHAEPTGLSTYKVRIVPRLWLLSQRKGHRIFQHLTAREIVQKLLDEWKIDATWTLARPHARHHYKVQYGETDLAFVHRILEEDGIAFTFDDGDPRRKLVLSDAPELAGPRAGAIPFVDSPNEVAGDWLREFAREVRVAGTVRPGARSLRDHDFRRTAHPLFGVAPKSPSPEDRYEQYRYSPGGSLVEVGPAGGAAEDDKATARHDDRTAQDRATRELEAMRGEKRTVTFQTNVIDIRPGTTLFIDRHPHPELPAGRKLLLLAFSMEGTPEDEWTMGGVATFADLPYRPPLLAKRPTARLQPAVVVGPAGQEIHTDEHGRVRVQFPWDREGKNDPDSTPWIRTSQGWAGRGYGMINLPRIGQEVLVDFQDGDPEQPVVVGRVHTRPMPVPYRLPDFKTRGGVKSDSSTGSNGYNEIYFEDLKGQEIVNLQAEKNLRHLVKNDEVITVGRDREKTVAVNEIETTVADRVQVTGIERSETIEVNKITVIGQKREMIIGKDETERTDRNHEVCVARDQDIMVQGMKREIVVEDDHLVIEEDHRDKVGGNRSSHVVEDQFEKVNGRYAKYAKEEMHLLAGSNLVLEAGFDLTVRGPAGFFRIGPGGVTLKGTMVKINSGGSPGSGKGSSPVRPELPSGFEDEEIGPDPEPSASGDGVEEDEIS